MFVGSSFPFKQLGFVCFDAVPLGRDLLHELGETGSLQIFGTSRLLFAHHHLGVVVVHGELFLGLFGFVARGGR